MGRRKQTIEDYVAKVKFTPKGCWVRNCVNPAHLFVGTAHDNMQDASRKGRLQRRHHFTILTKAQVQEIRNRLQTGEPCKSIARNYPVGMWAIHSIKQRKNWRAV